MGDLIYGGGGINNNVGYGVIIMWRYIYHNNMKRNWANFCITWGFKNGYTLFCKQLQISLGGIEY